MAGTTGFWGVKADQDRILALENAPPPTTMPEQQTWMLFGFDDGPLVPGEIWIASNQNVGVPFSAASYHGFDIWNDMPAAITPGLYEMRFTCDVNYASGFDPGTIWPGCVFRFQLAHGLFTDWRTQYWPPMNGLNISESMIGPTLTDPWPFNFQCMVSQLTTDPVPDFWLANARMMVSCLQETKEHFSP